MARDQTAERSPPRYRRLKTSRSIQGNAVRSHAIPSGRFFEDQTGKRRRERSRCDKPERRRTVSVDARVQRVRSRYDRTRVAFLHDARRDGLEQRLVAANGQHEVERSAVAKSTERVCRRAALYRSAARENKTREGDYRAPGAACRDGRFSVIPSQGPPSMSRRRPRWKPLKSRHPA